jgi:hypothetical protein
MSGLDWFALSTGVIGIIADVVTIASLARLDRSYQAAPTAIWVIAPILIIYSTIILSFYARRIALVRHLEAYGMLSEQMFFRINRGGNICAQVIGTPLLLLYGVSLVLFFGDRNDFIASILSVLFFGTIGAIFLMGILGSIAGAIYAAFDPTYVVTESKSKS